LILDALAAALTQASIGGNRSGQTLENAGSKVAFEPGPKAITLFSKAFRSAS